MFIIPFTSQETTLENAGGKGANLVRLTRAGFDVPHGFIISTDAYREFVEANRLDDAIQASIKELVSEDADGLEKASQKIRAAFSQGVMPSNIAQEVQTAYADINRQSKIGNPKSVAIRSSATAEEQKQLRLLSGWFQYSYHHLLSKLVWKADCPLTSLAFVWKLATDTQT